MWFSKKYPNVLAAPKTWPEIPEVGAKRHVTTTNAGLREVPVPERRAVSPRPIVEFAEYKALAEKLGISCPALQDEELLDFFAREEILVYPKEKVEAFLRSRAPAGMLVAWLPLRHVDPALAPPLTAPGSMLFDPPFRAFHYNKPVPLSTLKLVDQILTAFPKAQFYVSDYAVPRPDPFLFVKLPGGASFVIDHWDEPDFKLFGK